MSKDLHDKAVECLPVFDQMIAGLKDEDPESIEAVRDVLHEMIDLSNSKQLYVMLLGPMKLLESVIERGDKP